MSELGEGYGRDRLNIRPLDEVLCTLRPADDTISDDDALDSQSGAIPTSSSRRGFGVFVWCVDILYSLSLGMGRGQRHW